MSQSTALVRFKTIPQRLAAFGRKALSIIAERPPFYPITMIRNGVTPVETNRGLFANVVMAPVMWIQRTFTEAELVIQRRKADGIWENVLDHPIETLIDQPNDTYDGDALWKATALSYTMAGNAYWWKIRNVFGEVIQLWYVPHWMIRPVSGPDGLGNGSSRVIDAYAVSMGVNGPVYLEPRDVVHFRFGLDPEDTRMGLPPLRSVWREIESDMQAAVFSDTVLTNMGVPGLILSPKDAASTPTPEQLNELRAYLKTAASGGNAGSNLVFGKPTDVVQLGFNPQTVNLDATRDVAEERVCAILGIPAAVVGFGAGLQSTKVGATMRELVKAAWVQCLIPMQKTLARQVTSQLLPDFHAQLRRYRAWFDMTEASSFQEEFNLRATSVAQLVAAGILRVDRAQQMLGLEVDTTRQVYYIPTATPAVDPNADPMQPTAPPSDQPPEDVLKMLAGIESRLPKRLQNGLHNGNGSTNGNGAPR
jgi:HK97 family phage portal protein